MKHLAKLAGKRGCCKRGQCIHWQAERVVAEIERLRLGADRLAYECATAIVRGRIRPRSRISDRLEDYLEIGGIDGPATVPEWIEQYEAAKAADEKLKLPPTETFYARAMERSAEIRKAVKAGGGE